MNCLTFVIYNSLSQSQHLEFKLPSNHFLYLWLKLLFQLNILRSTPSPEHGLISWWFLGYVQGLLINCGSLTFVQGLSCSKVWNQLASWISSRPDCNDFNNQHFQTRVNNLKSIKIRSVEGFFTFIWLLWKFAWELILSCSNEHVFE